MIIEKNHVTSSAVSPSSVGGGGLVRGVVTYTVMDDLVVKPKSTISCIALLNRFDVRDVGCLEESVAEIGFNEGLAILKASLNSKEVLTTVFLGKR
ncbi:hypothetical protein AAC387_Pa07g3672 [Persea americana]